MARTSTAALTALIALTGVTAACVDEERREQAEFVDEQLAQMDEAREQQTGPARPIEDDLDADQFRCIGDGYDGGDLVDILGDPSADGVAQRVALTNRMIECVPDLHEVDEYVASVEASLELAAGDELDLTRDQASCYLRYMIDESEDAGRALVAPTEGDLLTSLEAFDACFSPEQLAALYGEAGTGPQRYGDDELYDELYDTCADGDDRACDLLYLTSTIDSEYQSFGLTCGDRSDGASWCTAGLDVDDTGQVAVGSPILDELAVDCEAGDLIACDLLYQVAPLGSDAEQIGNTCGGKVPLGALPNCRASLR